MDSGCRRHCFRRRITGRCSSPGLAQGVDAAEFSSVAIFRRRPKVTDMTRYLLSLALVAGAVLIAEPLSAQADEREDVRIRNDCRLAAQVLRTGHPAPRRAWALGAIRRCGTSGPSVLADVWRERAPSDTTELGELFAATRDFNDRRVVDAVAEVALRAQAPETTRIYALALLFNYAVPGQYLDFQDLLQPQGILPALSSMSHDTRAHETRAMLGDLRPEVRELLGSVIATEQDSQVGKAAGIVLRLLSHL